MLVAQPASAIPPFARQTGLACEACHTLPPELTPFGRRFKLSGYTLTTRPPLVTDTNDNKQNWMHVQSTGEAINLSLIERRRGVPIPPLDQLVESARAKINSGVVKIARPAHERQEPFRNSDTNHFMSQLLSFRPEAREQPAELVAALCTGVGLWSNG